MGSLLQGFLPALAGDDAALGVEVEENVVPAVRGEPSADLDGFVVVAARVTDEKARHGLKPSHPGDRRSSGNSSQLWAASTKPHVTWFTLRWIFRHPVLFRNFRISRSDT